MIDLRISTTNVIFTQSHEVLASYTLYEKGETIASQENICIFLQQVIDHMSSQRYVVEEILVTGTSRIRQELVCFLQKNLTIKIDDFDKKLALHPPMMTFSEHDAVCSASFLAGGITFCERKNHIHLDLLPASLLARRYRNQERPYTFRAMIFIMCTLLAWSLYFQHASGDLMTLTAKIQMSLIHEEEEKFSLKQTEAQLERTQEKQWAINNLLEKHLLWPHLLSELQKALPGHALFITKLSPITNENPRGDSITALELEGISLESPQEADAVHRFIQALTKSNLFEVNPQEKITSYDALSDKQPNAYPWKFRLSLKPSMSDIVY
jgi:Tfp pilus assembly protein PilN